MSDDLSTMGTVDLVAARYKANARLEDANDALAEAEKEHRAATQALQEIDDALDLTIACPWCYTPVGEPCWVWVNRDGRQQVHTSRHRAATEQAADDLGRMP